MGGMLVPSAPSDGLVSSHHLFYINFHSAQGSEAPVLQYLSVGILDNHLISVALVFCWSFVFKSVEQEDKRQSLNSMISKILFLILNTFVLSFPWDLLNSNTMEPF